MPTLTLPDGAHVELPEGEPVGAALPKGTIAARVDGELRDLVVRAVGRRRSSSPIAPAVRRRAARAASLDRARARAGGLRSLPGREVRDRPRGRRRLLLRLRSARARARGRPREDRPAHAPDREAEPAVRARGGLARGGDRAAARPAVQGRDHRGHRRRAPTTEARREAAAGETVSLYSNDGWVDLCMGPHVPHTGVLGRLQAHERRRRVLARRRAQPAAHPHLRHRLGEQGATSTRTCTGSRKPNAATTASSALELDLFSFPDEIGSGLAVFHPQGRPRSAG